MEIQKCALGVQYKRGSLMFIAAMLQKTVTSETFDWEIFSISQRKELHQELECISQGEFLHVIDKQFLQIQKNTQRLQALKTGFLSG